ncbi:ladinin-1 isoform X1 [Protopterus annectens]|uniref:ladinin-1 isoform X1 n=1 Tax=Protopterus annectens TaxID=7888 RepID=UPI001CF9B928|nr:ladinin-1 isoform X1 [Protopterus annectens]
MSIGRRNWSALSSLAKQWSIEDEEEQERERRRKQRMNSLTDSEDNSLSNGPEENQKYTVLESPEEEEAEDPEISKTDDQKRKFIEILKSRDERRQKRHIEVLQNLKMDHQNHQRWQHDEDDETAANQDPDEQKQQHKKNVVNSVLEREEQREQRKWRCDRNNAVKPRSEEEGQRQQQTVKDTTKTQGQDVQAIGKNKSLMEQPDLSNNSNHSQKYSAAKDVAHETENHSNTPVEDSPKALSTKVYRSSLKMPLERNLDNWKENSKQEDIRDSDLEFNLTNKKESDKEEDLKSSVQAANSGCPDQQAQLGDARSHVPQMETEKPHVITFSGISQIKESEPSPLIPEEKQTNTETDSSESSKTPFMRSTPRGTSFRLTRKVPTEASLRRSASLRIPSSALGERLQRYTSAAQKSESVKSPLSPTKAVFLPEGVASKRSLFEKAQRDNESNTAGLRKDTPTGHGGLRSRFKQWRSQSPESDKSKAPKEIITVDVSSKRNLWEKRSASGTSPSS